MLNSVYIYNQFITNVKNKIKMSWVNLTITFFVIFKFKII